MFNEPDLSSMHETALGAGLMRGVHLLYDDEPKIFSDRYAIPLLGLPEEKVLDFARRGSRRSTALWVSRSRFAEDRLVGARSRGVSQYVVLGAGLDSFALRHAETLADLVVYEVDDPPMQAWKRRRIEELNLPLPSALRFVPCDFETVAISEALGDGGFIADAQTFVSWLGVTQYLTRDAVAETLNWVSQLSRGSEIVLTFVVPGPDAEAEKEQHAARGTRFETFFTPDQVADLLTEAGLAAEVFTPEEIDVLYFQERNDGLHASTLEQFVIGRTR
jgi:methyltransferase (TIGR00027 family)